LKKTICNKKKLKKVNELISKMLFTKFYPMNTSFSLNNTSCGPQ
jgi:hypothetical protein